MEQESPLIQDAFALRSQVLHPALAHNRAVSDEVDPSLFDKFFQSPAFCAWISGTRSWQLHCYGEPGCGKTTVAAIAKSRVPCEVNGARTAVASISINEHLASKSTDFIEDLLQCIHESFGDEQSHDFRQYQVERQKGMPIIERIRKLSDILNSATPNICKYLILDGYDCINEALQHAIDVQLSRLQSSGVKVMTTRRVPAFFAPFDAEYDECKLNKLELWWECLKCKEACKDFWLCYDCMEKKDRMEPHGCEAADFKEMYPHVSIKLGDLPVESLITKRIKRHYFEVGADTGEQIAEYIKHKVSGNITLALLYLEDVFMRSDFTLLTADSIQDRLPRGVVAFFDAEMKRIECRPEPQRLPPLLAIAAAAHSSHGISLTELENLIYLAHSTSLRSDYPRSLEDIFKTANGWLIDPRTVKREVDICCKPAFSLYIKEDYNKSLALAKLQLRNDTQHGTADVMSKDSSGTSQLTGRTLDTLDSGLTNQTPPQSIHSALGLLGQEGTVNSPMLVDEERRMALSPPRMNSTENLDHTEKISHDNSDQRDSFISHRGKKTFCDFCTSEILDSEASSGQHHISSLLAERSTDHCILCSSLYSLNDPGRLSSTAQPFPLYHWSFRALPRGRVLKGSMVLKFQPTDSALASKSFYFLSETGSLESSSNPLKSSTNPKESGGDQIKGWMNSCTRNHESCNDHSDVESFDASSFRPTRLIDVDTGNDDIVRLIETKVTKAKGPYCTLSHSWGPREKKLPTTTVWNMAKHLLDGIKMSELPPNFQQAIEVTRFLNIRYIWIDSLVIVQEPFGDFEREGDLMHKVYRHSYCNIVAADSTDGYGGLFRDRDPDSVLPAQFRSRANCRLGENKWTIVPADLWERELLSSFIYTRGWVFQERMLSPRILHFTKNQIFWDCGTLSACESFPDGLPFALDNKASTDRHWRGRLNQIGSRALSGANDNESSYTIWVSAVQNYTDCNLTNQDDKTVAIWSVAKLLRDISSEQYAVGMWSNFLEEQLAWRVHDIERSERTPELQVKIPSWSWASVKGPILPHHRLADRTYKALNHEGGDLCFTLKPSESSDTEPKLDTKLLAVAGVINTGIIIAASGGYLLRVPGGSQQSVHLDVYPDEVLPNSSLKVDLFAVTILAASFSKPTKRYSGIGLLLIERSSWYKEQEEGFRALQRETKDCTGLPRETKWRIEAFEKLVLQKSQLDERSDVYRRMGAVRFRGLDEWAYGRLQKGPLRKFWIE